MITSITGGCSYICVFPSKTFSWSNPVANLHVGVQLTPPTSNKKLTYDLFSSQNNDDYSTCTRCSVRLDDQFAM